MPYVGWSLLKRTAESWNRHEAPRMGAALAYYTVFSMAPLIVITLAIAGAVYGNDTARAEIVNQIQNVAGDVAGNVVRSVLQNARTPSSGVFATLISVITLFIGASGVFIELRSSLNRIWDVPVSEASTTVSATVRVYLLSVALVIGIGFLLLVSLILSTTLELFEHWLANQVPLLPLAARIFSTLFSFVVISVLFGLIYKFVPDTHILWADVRHGAIATAILFTLGKYALALYIAKASVGSAYGAAGSIMALLVWVYYSAQIFFFGAEFTHMYALDCEHLRTMGARCGIGPTSATHSRGSASSI